MSTRPHNKLPRHWRTTISRSGAAWRSHYTANALNQYEERTVPGTVQVRGEADEEATVTVNGNATFRFGRYFYGGDSVDNSASHVFKELAIEATDPEDPDYLEASTGRVFVAQSPEMFSYDADGNMLTDGRFRYYWNAENRLVRAEELYAPPSRAPYTIAAHYDYSPFGEILVQSGDMADAFTHRFSTKPYCPITRLCEYQMRKYRPEIGRWLSRNPIGEFASLNVSLFCANDAVLNWDLLGQTLFSWEGVERVVLAGIGGAFSGAFSGAISGGISRFFIGGPAGFLAGASSGAAAGALAGGVSGMLAQVYDEVFLPKDNLSGIGAISTGVSSGLVSGTTVGAFAAANAGIEVSHSCLSLKRVEAKAQLVVKSRTAINATIQATAAYVSSDGNLKYVTFSTIFSILGSLSSSVCEEIVGSSIPGIILGIEFGFLEELGKNYLQIIEDF